MVNYHGRLGPNLGTKGTRSMRRLILSLLVLTLAAGFLAACGAGTPQAQATSAPEVAPTSGPQAEPTSPDQSAIANPASVNCVTLGGTLEIRTRSDGSQFGVCYFEDNRQCEEWALLRGDCPAGGLKITGYVTEAAQYCAITGGQYAITGNSNTDQEQGTCTFKTGQICDAKEYYAGNCSPAAGAEQQSYGDPFTYCAAVGTVDTPGAEYDGPAMPDAVVQGMVRLGIVTADAPPSFQKNAVWRCMDGKVWVCHFGANLPCQEKADTSQVPSAAIRDFCTANPTSDSVPAAVTGRATVYEWKCADGQPQVARQLFESDPQGFLAGFWYELAPQ
jgi:putative hemolysin